MRRPKKPKKAAVREWFALGCLALVGAAGIVAVSILASRPRTPDHPARLLEAPGVIPWHTLSKVTLVQRNGKPVLRFGDGIQALDGKQVKLRGYITPLQLGAGQEHFLLSTKPPSCAFCVPAGPDEMVEVFSKTPVRYSLEPVTIAGRFAVLDHDPDGLLYRMAEAVPLSAGRL